MTQIIKEGGKTIIKTGERIDTMNAPQFEQDIQPALRTVMQQKGQFKMTNVSPEIYKVLSMTGFTKFMKVEKKAE